MSPAFRTRLIETGKGRLWAVAIESSRGGGVASCAGGTRSTRSRVGRGLLLFGISILAVSQEATPGGGTGKPGVQSGSELEKIRESVAAVLTAEPGASTRARALDSYRKMPLLFEPNSGQSDPLVQFVARGAGFVAFLTSEGLVLRLLSAEPGHVGSRSRAPSTHSTLPPELEENVVRVKPSGGSTEMKWVGEGLVASRSHYFVGQDREGWITDVSNYTRVGGEAVYPGVDLVFHGEQAQLEFDFVVAPGADPSAISLEFDGIDTLELDPQGNLGLGTEREIRFARPSIYQQKDGKRVDVDGAYSLNGNRRVGFRVGEYDETLVLIIDPLLLYSTFLGGSTFDFGHAVAVDKHGSAYVAGQSLSPDFPVTAIVGPPAPVRMTAFVAKLNPAGSSILYSAFVGGTDVPWARNIQFDMMAIEVDEAGNAYLIGDTTSKNFPTLNAVQPLPGGRHDAFVTKIGPGGNSLVYSTYLGGSDQDWGRGLALDASLNLWLVGVTQSRDFPTAMPLQPQLAGSADAFVAKLDPAGSTLIFSTYLGGSTEPQSQGPRGDLGYDIATDDAGNAYITGFTSSTDFPTVNPVQGTFGGGAHDIFVSKISSDGSVLNYSTYLGGTDREEGLAIAVDGAGSAHITGWTTSDDFPTFSPIQGFRSGDADLFITKLSPDGQDLTFSTYLGGRLPEVGYDIALDASGDIYVAGSTHSYFFPVVDPVQADYGGGSFDGVVVKLDAAGSRVVYATFLGGSGDENRYFTSVGIDVSASGNAFVAGSTASPDFPTVGPAQAELAGSVNAFVSKISITPEVFVSISRAGEQNVLGFALTNGSSSSRDVEVVVWARFGAELIPLLPAALVTTLPPSQIWKPPDVPLPPEWTFPGAEIGARLLESRHRGDSERKHLRGGSLQLSRFSKTVERASAFRGFLPHRRGLRTRRLRAFAFAQGQAGHRID